MPLIRPFRALRPDFRRAPDVSAVPYDVVNQEEAHHLAQNNPWSFLHVSRPEIDLPAETPIYSNAVYQKAATAFESLIQECPFIEETQPALYLYRLRMGSHEQTGIVGTFSIDDYVGGKIKKHERTRPDKEDDRTRHILELKAQTGPVFLTYRSIPEMNLEVKKVKDSAPLYDFTSPDHISHTLWLIPHPESLIQLFEQKVSALYIADGHHRAAAASRVRTELARQNPTHRGDEPYNFMLAVAFPDDQLQIFPYHRLIKELSPLSATHFLEKVRGIFEVTQEHQAPPQLIRGEFGMFLERQWYRLKAPGDLKKEFELDATLLQEVLLGPILGIQDPRTDQRIEFVGGIRGTIELENKVNSGVAAVAFALYPTSLSDVMQVSDRGEIMPPKSTWFEPKLRDGLFCYSLK